MLQRGERNLPLNGFVLFLNFNIFHIIFSTRKKRRNQKSMLILLQSNKFDCFGLFIFQIPYALLRI